MKMTLEFSSLQEAKAFARTLLNEEVPASLHTAIEKTGDMASKVEEALEQQK